MKYDKDFKDLILLLPKGRNREASALRHFIAAVICSTCMAKSTLHTSSWAYKEKQDACQCSKRLTDAILFCWKNTWRNFFTRRQSSAVFKIQHTFDRHAWWIFSAPLNRKRQCILKNLGEMLQIKNRVGKTNTHTHTNACLHPALLSRRLLSRCCCEFLFALNTDIPPVPHAAAHCSNSRPVDQCSLNLRAWIIIEALASIDWSAEGQLQYERRVDRNITYIDQYLQKAPRGGGI